jgi:hypothetical protein
MATAENAHSGQGPVLLDIGGDVGAVVVAMPASTEGLEVEIRPAGATPGRAGHDTGGSYPHVAVVARPTGAGMSYALVYPAVLEGEHELFPLPGGPVAMTVTVTGGSVTQAAWPRDPA